MSHWGDLVSEKVRQSGPLMLGIDPVWGDIPEAFKTARTREDALSDYVETLLSMAAGEVGFVKFQAAFFEAFGLAGLRVLSQACKAARTAGIAIVMDAKRGDIGTTAKAYADAFLVPETAGGSGDFEADCLTVNPYLGPDGLTPFVDAARAYGKGLFILVKTSNPGSAWLQDQVIGDETVAELSARLVHTLGEDLVGVSGLSAIGAVIGATHPHVLDRLRARMPDAIMLCPGLGPQGGSVDNILRLRRSDGSGVLAPVSRGLTRPGDRAISLADYRDLVRANMTHYKAALAG